MLKKDYVLIIKKSNLYLNKPACKFLASRTQYYRAKLELYQIQARLGSLPVLMSTNYIQDDSRKKDTLRHESDKATNKYKYEAHAMLHLANYGAPCSAWI